MDRSERLDMHFANVLAALDAWGADENATGADWARKHAADLRGEPTAPQPDRTTRTTRTT